MLHQQLPDSILKPQLPALLSRKAEPHSDMCIILKTYLEQISSMPGAWNSSLINDFLDDASGILHLQVRAFSISNYIYFFI